jgi:hypothetical protein
MALPMMRASEFGAQPQIRDPISKSPRAMRKIQFALYSMYSLPNMSWKQQVVRR